MLPSPPEFVHARLVAKMPAPRAQAASAPLWPNMWAPGQALLLGLRTADFPSGAGARAGWDRRGPRPRRSRCSATQTRRQSGPAAVSQHQAGSSAGLRRDRPTTLLVSADRDVGRADRVHRDAAAAAETTLRPARVVRLTISSTPTRSSTASPASVHPRCVQTEDAKCHGSGVVALRVPPRGVLCCARAVIGGLPEASRAPWLQLVSPWPPAWGAEPGA